MKSYYVVRLVDGMVMQFDASKTTVDYEDNPNAVAIREGGLAMKHQKIVAVIPVKQLLYIKLVEEESEEEEETKHTNRDELLRIFGETLINNNCEWNIERTPNGMHILHCFYKSKPDEKTVKEFEKACLDSGLANKICWIKDSDDNA